MPANDPSAAVEPEDREWLAAVGLMAVYWADFEIAMDTYLAVLLVHPSAHGLWSEKAANTDEMLDISFNKRIRIWKDLLGVVPVDGENKRKSRRLADRARDARNHRDLLLHGITRRYPDGQMKANRLPRKTGQQVQLVPYPPEKVLKIAGEILDLNASVTHLMIQTMMALQEGSQKKSGE